jgi:hypothetical protein
MANSSPRPTRHALTKRDHSVLAYISRFRLLSRDQLMALAPFGSLTRANTRLAILMRAGLLARKQLPLYPGHGSAQALYYLTAKCGGLVETDSAELAQRQRQIGRWDMRQIEHVRAANQVLINLVAAIEGSSNTSLDSFRTEPELRRIFLERSLVPDGWISWSANGQRFNCFLEIDLHHEGLKEWRKKILEYRSYAESGLNQELFGFRFFRILVLAKSRVRLNNLRQVAAEAGQLFGFAQIDQIDSRNILDAIWLPAAGNTPASLMEL